MVWRPSTLFAGISCPHGESCDAITCMFSHNAPTETSVKVCNPIDAKEAAKSIITARRPEPPSKPVHKEKQISGRGVTAPATLTRSISPPIQNARPALPNSVPKFKKSQTLNPRMVPRAPLPHEKRTTFLKALHAELVKRNAIEQTVENKTKKSKSDIESRGIVLTGAEMIEAALSMEEEMAKSQGTNYAGAMRSQVRAYKNMASQAWTKHLIKLFPEKGTSTHENNGNAVRGSTFTSTLSRELELQVLQHLVVKNISALSTFGYVADLPSDAEVKESAAGVAISKNFERCDRCGSNFQVFPTRREDGKLTTNGPCSYHPDKLEYPARVDKSNRHLVGSGTLDPFFPCCHEGRGSRGCTEHEHHVFKVSSTARLATTLPFVETPRNISPLTTRTDRKVDAVAFDCEMGYTSWGFELLRLTAVTWPDGEPLIDILVRPMGILLDFNTRFSGVSQEDFDAAQPLESGDPLPKILPNEGTHGTLPIARSPLHAREILCKYITPSTPLIGHGIENDLRVVRLCHKTIVDTVLLYPHPRKLPFRYRLQHLTKTYLKRDIQGGGPQGHDSLEDSIATGDLVRAKVQEKMTSLQRNGWTVVDEKLQEPKSVKRVADPGPELNAIKKSKNASDGPSMAEYLAMSKADASIN